jgi:hypothetical protein
LANKKITVSVLIIILLLSSGIYFYYFSLKNDEKASDLNKGRELQQENTLNQSLDDGVNKDSLQEEEPITDSANVKNNKYYIVYIRQENGSGSSFIPLNLNPNFKNDSDYHVSLSFDDNGDIINNDKVIEIDNFSISKDNKEAIKKIAGTEKYNEALKEIEERVTDTKKGLEEEGLL